MEALLFLLVAGIIAVPAYRFVTASLARAEQRRLAVKALAHGKGWSFDNPPPRGLAYRIQGVTAGLGWELKADPDSSSSESSPSTTWTCEEIHFADLVGMIRTRAGYRLLEGAWGRAATGLLGAMTAMMRLDAPQHGRLMKEGARLEPGSSDVAENFVIVVRPGLGLENMLTAEVQHALRQWHDSAGTARDSLAVDIGQSNLRVYCSQILDASEVEAMVGMGVALAAALRPNRRHSGQR